MEHDTMKQNWTLEELDAAIARSRVDMSSLKLAADGASRIVANVFAEVRRTALEREEMRSVATMESLYARINI